MMKTAWIAGLLLLLGGVLAADDLLRNLKPQELQSGNGMVKLVEENGRKTIQFSGQVGPKSGNRNLYLDFSIMFSPAIDLQGKTLKIEAASPTGAAGFYVRAYNAGASKPVWSFLSWDGILKKTPAAIDLTANRSGMMAWEAAEVSKDAAGRVNRLRFYIGTPDGGSKQELLITKLELVLELPCKEDPAARQYTAASLPAPKLKQAVSLPTATTLVKAGKAESVILHPDTPAGKQAGEEIAAAIKEAAGVAVPVRAGTPNDAIPDRNAIVLGNLFSNPALSVLYARQQTLADEFLPGPGGCTIESIIEPFRPGNDVIVLGASDDAGLAAAAGAFRELVKSNVRKGELAIPLTFKTSYTSKVAPDGANQDHLELGIKDARERLAKGVHTSLGGMLAETGARYLLHRNSADARLYVEIAKIYAKSVDDDPRKFGGPWGFDSDFPSYQAIAAWDLIEHDPALSAEDRLTVSNVLLRWLHEAIFAEARIGLNERGPVHNHQTFCSLGSLMGAFYFGKYYDKQLPHPAVWLDTAKKNFSRQTASGKAYDDCDGYQWLTWQHVMLFSMALPDPTIFENGVAKKMIKVAGTTMDNLGTQAPYGDNKYWKSNSAHLIVLEMYYAATRDPLTAYILSIKRKDKFNPLPGRFYGKLGHSEAVPTGLDGVTVIALDPDYYRYLPAEGALPPQDKCFDKFSFREKLDPQGLYVLVDGVNNGGHRHADANSVLRYSHFGREWLAENDYFKNQQKYHNSLLLLYNGEAFVLPDYMELVEQGEAPDYAWVTVRAKAVGPAIWTRHYIWFKKDRAWMLIDEIEAGKTGRYQITQRWNGVGERSEKPDGYQLEQKGALMRLQTSGDTALKTYDDADLGQEWVTYPYADPIIRVIDQAVEKEISAGEKVRLAAVWHGAAGGADVPEWEVTRISNGFSVNTGETVYRAVVDQHGKLNLTNANSTEPVKPPQAKKVNADAVNGSPAQIAWRDMPYKRTPPAGESTPGVGLAKAAYVKDKDGDYWAVGSQSGELFFYSPDGKKLDSLQFPAAINDIAVLDIDKDGKSELLLACQDAYLRAIKRDGRELWNKKFEFYRLYPDVTIVKTADLNGDGEEEIIVGCDNWRTYVMDQKGKDVWNYEVVHPVRAIRIADLDGDGKPELICGTRYMWATVLDNQGRKRWGSRFGVGCRAVAAPLNGTSRNRNVVLGVDSGLVTFHDKDGKEIGRFLTGDEIVMMAEGIEENGRQDVFAGSFNGYVYRFAADGKKIWHRALPFGLTVICALPDGGVAAGTLNGDVYVLNAKGEISKYAKCNGKVTGLLVADGLLIVTTAGGDLTALKL